MNIYIYKCIFIRIYRCVYMENELIHNAFHINFFSLFLIFFGFSFLHIQFDLFPQKRTTNGSTFIILIAISFWLKSFWKLFFLVLLDSKEREGEKVILIIVHLCDGVKQVGKVYFSFMTLWLVQFYCFIKWMIILSFTESIILIRFFIESVSRSFVQN